MDSLNNSLVPLDEPVRHGKTGIVAGLVVSYLLTLGVGVGGATFMLSERSKTDKKINDLQAEVTSKTKSIQDLIGEGKDLQVANGKLTITGDLMVGGKATVGNGVEVTGETLFNGKVTVSNPLVIKRSQSADDYLLQYKTGEDVNWSVGASSASGSDRSALNFYNGSGLNEPVAILTSSGQFSLANSANGVNAFRIQNAANTDIFNVNTKDNKITSSVVLETKQLVVGGGTTIGKILFGTCSVDPSELTAADKNTASCTATGTLEGDKVFLVAPETLEEDILWWSMGVTDKDTIKIKLKNDSVGIVNGTSRTWSWFAIR